MGVDLIILKIHLAVNVRKVNGQGVMVIVVPAAVLVID
jgi:hypothetical protein